MPRRLIIHDLEPTTQGVGQMQDLLFSAVPQVKSCTGCFGCWLKTPGKCVIADRCQAVPSMMAACEEAVFVSRLVYGGFSPAVKAVLDRSIGYVMPFFRIVNGEMHHTMRYDNAPKLTVHFYSERVSAQERAIAERLVAANAVNLGAKCAKVYFHATATAAKEALG